MNMDELPILFEVDGNWINLRAIIGMRPIDTLRSVIYCTDAHSFRVDVPMDQVMDRLYDTLAAMNDNDLGLPIASVVANPPPMFPAVTVQGPVTP